MKTVIFNINIDGKVYEIPVTFKRQRNMYLRMKDDGFTCSASIFMSQRSVERHLYDLLPKLIKRIDKRKKDSKEPPRDEDYTYILGSKEEGYIDDKELKEIAKKVLTDLTREVEKEMNITKPYKVSIRNMKTRFGSNSIQTHSISYQLALIHFDKEIIRTVVVHELAHHFVRNHQKAFYDVVLKYSPNYYELQRKLKRGIYR